MRKSQSVNSSKNDYNQSVNHNKQVIKDEMQRDGTLWIMRKNHRRRSNSSSIRVRNVLSIKLEDAFRNYNGKRNKISMI